MPGPDQRSSLHHLERQLIIFLAALKLFL